jgi:inner membrane protein
MASLLTHPIVPIALGAAFGRKLVSSKLLFLGIFLSMLPDADAIGFWLGVPYAHALGHRGFTHSILFAILVAAAATPLFKENRTRAFIFLCFASASHGILDALTNGGLGVGFFIPVDNERYFFPLTPLRVSPMGVRAFISSRGLSILYTEFIWVWIPCGVIAAMGIAIRNLKARA